VLPPVHDQHLLNERTDHCQIPVVSYVKTAKLRR
jgi:hypothetical protein